METHLIRRSLPSEIAASTGRTLRGLIPYNAPTRITERGRTFTEVIRPGAFARSLGRGGDVLSTFNHDPNRLLGRTSSGTLRIHDTAAGLAYEVDLPASAADVQEWLVRGDLKGSSFAAVPYADGQKWTADTCELVGLELIELGPVVMPYYAASQAVVRSESSPVEPRLKAWASALLGLMQRS